MKKFLILLLFLTGCASVVKLYDASSLTSQKPAIYKVSSSSKLISFENFNTLRIDNKNLTFLGLPIYRKSVLEILPGKHDVTIMYIGSGTATTKLWFIAEEGKKYRPNGEINGYKVVFWIEEVETGKKVGGIKGSVDEPEK